MSIQKISESEISAAGVASLSTRPTAPYAYGGEGLTPAELKARFDRLPRLVAERLNLLIEAVRGMPEEEQALSALIPTGIEEGHTLARLFLDLLDGTAARYVRVGGGSIQDAIFSKEARVRVLFPEEEVLTVEGGCDYRFGTVRSLSLELPEYPPLDFTAVISFDSEEGNGETAVSYPEGLRFSGDDIVEGAFCPFGKKHYTLFIWYDGAWQAAVRGVAA